MSDGKIKFDSLGGTLGFQLRRASHAVALSYEAAFEPLGLRISDATILIGIGENPGCTQADLSRSLHIKPANLVPVVSGLAAKHLVARIAGGGRGVSLHLTEDGAMRLGDVHRAIQKQEQRIRHLIAGLDEDMFLMVLKAIAKKPHRQTADQQAETTSRASSTD